jgi:hypothetical protein
VQARVADRLAGSLADVDADVVAAGRPALLDLRSDLGHQRPDHRLLRDGQREEVRLVPANAPA